MSSMASPSVQGARRPVAWGRVALIGLATILAATVVNAIVYFIAGAFVRYDPEFPPLANVGAVVIFTAFFAFWAVVAYALVLRFSRNLVRTYLIVAAIGLVVALIPDFAVIPTTPGVTVGQNAVLVLLHFTGAAVIVPMLTTLARPAAR